MLDTKYLFTHRQEIWVKSFFRPTTDIVARQMFSLQIHVGTVVDKTGNR